MYRLYAQKQQGGWENISHKPTLEEIKGFINKLQKDGYYAYMIIKNEGQGDEIVERNKLQEQDEKQKVQKFKNKYKVEEEQLNKSKSSNRAKQKEELRKLTDDYLK